jgi:hypothetical protein
MQLFSMLKIQTKRAVNRETNKIEITTGRLSTGSRENKSVAGEHAEVS